MGGLACWSNKNGAITRCNLVFDTLVCLNRVPGIPSYRFSDFLYLVSACGPRWASEFGVSSNTEDVAGWLFCKRVFSLAVRSQARMTHVEWPIFIGMEWSHQDRSTMIYNFFLFFQIQRIWPSIHFFSFYFHWRLTFKRSLFSKGVQIKAELEATLVGQGSTLRWTLGSLWRVQARS